MSHRQRRTNSNHASSYKGLHEINIGARKQYIYRGERVIVERKMLSLPEPPPSVSPWYSTKFINRVV
jgi:hypothetical protein